MVLKIRMITAYPGRSNDARIHEGNVRLAIGNISCTQQRVLRARNTCTT